MQTIELYAIFLSFSEAIFPLDALPASQFFLKFRKQMKVTLPKRKQMKGISIEEKSGVREGCARARTSRFRGRSGDS
jgi:hypothetical protein